jgi:hypothetical protein
VERHFTGSDTVRDIVIGMSEGLTVPYALAAGLSGVAARFRGAIPMRSAFQTALVGGLAATAAFVLAKLIS